MRKGSTMFKLKDIQPYLLTLMVGLADSIPKMIEYLLERWK